MPYLVKECPACEAGRLEFREAIIAPFVAARVFGSRSKRCRLARCGTCCLVFYEQRYDDNEVERLYAGYRSDDYYQTRHRYEPWYTKTLNSRLGAAEDITIRRKAYHSTLSEFGVETEPETVLDYGGDRGQLMCGGPGRQHFVFDISGVEPEPGVVRIAGATALQSRRFDLVLLCEVLEHVSQPLLYLRNITNHVQPNGLLYVTVPNREFRFEDIPSGAWYRTWLRLLLSNQMLTIAADFWSTTIRKYFKRVPPLGFVKMHEHINVFDFQSLTSLLSRAGYTVLTCKTYMNGVGLLALCRRNSESATNG